MLICPYCKERASGYKFLWANGSGYAKMWYFGCGRWVEETLSYKNGFKWCCYDHHQCKLVREGTPLLTDKLSQDDLPF